MSAPLIILPGALDKLEGSGIVAHALAASRRVTNIDYRPDDRLGSLLDRIASAAAAGPCDLLGQSYGGWIAQCFARRHPALTRRLILSHSFVLGPGDAWRFRLGEALLRRLPQPLLRTLLLKRVRNALAPLAATDPALVERQLATLAAELAKPAFRAKLAAQQRCMRDSLRSPFTAIPALQPDLSVLIIESDNDPLIGPSARAALRATFPRAEVRCFAGAGHVSAMVRSEDYLSAVRAFLDA